MQITIEITEHDIQASKNDNMLPIMYALGRAGFLNAYVEPTDHSKIVSATVSHIEASVVKSDLKEDGSGFHHLELSDTHAVAFGLHVDDGLDRRERDDLINPTIEPANQTTSEVVGDLSNPSPNSERADHDAEGEPAESYEPLQG